MRKNLLIILLPLSASVLYLAADVYLDAVLYPNYVEWPGRMFALCIFVVVFFVSRSYLNLRGSDRLATDNLRQVTQENKQLGSAVAELEQRVRALTGDADASRKALHRAVDNMDALGVIVLTIDCGCAVRSVNRKGCHVLGYGKNDIVGREFFDNFVPSSVRAFARNEAKKLMTGDPGAERDYTGLLVDRNGVERLIAWHHCLLKDDEGGPAGLLSAGEDVTQRAEDEAKDAELRNSRARTLRMRALAVFAEGIAKQFAEILKRIHPAHQDPGDAPEISTDENDVEAPPEKQVSSTAVVAKNDDSAGREAAASAFKDAEAMVADIARIGGATGLDATEVDLNRVVRACLNNAEFSVIHEARPSISVNMELAEDLLPVTGAEPRIEQALWGLVARAMSMARDGGTVVVRTKNLHIGEESVRYEAIPEGNYAVVWVVDDGEEIDAECLDRIFEPFGCLDQTKAAPLSLALTYGIVKAHAGFVNVKSEAGIGTEFALCLPVTVKEYPANVRLANLPHGTERILVIDDFEQERTVAKRFLEVLGYKVAVAASGREALKLFQDCKGGKSPFDLMLLDMILGANFDGLDTYRETVKLFPGQKCIIVSGYAESDRTQEAARLGASRFLAKPYTLEGMAAAVREELDEKIL